MCFCEKVFSSITLLSMLLTTLLILLFVLLVIQLGAITTLFSQQVFVDS